MAWDVNNLPASWNCSEQSHSCTLAHAQAQQMHRGWSRSRRVRWPWLLPHSPRMCVNLRWQLWCELRVWSAMQCLWVLKVKDKRTKMKKCVSQTIRVNRCAKHVWQFSVYWGPRSSPSKIDEKKTTILAGRAGGSDRHQETLSSTLTLA